MISRLGAPCQRLCLAGLLLLTGAVPARGQSFERITNDGQFKQRPAWSPDGRWVVFTRHSQDAFFLYARNVEQGTERRVTKRDAPECDAVFSPDGTELVFAMDKASPNQGDMDVCRVSWEGETLTVVAASDGKLSHEESPTWSPDGQRIAYTSTAEGNQELYVIHKDGQERRRLTTHPGIDAHPSWSPDGTRIAFATDRWGDLEIAVVAVESGQVQRITHSPGLDDYPAWSPDGLALAFTSNRDGNLEIYRCNAAGEELRNVSGHPGIDNFPGWQPGGRLSFISNRDGGFDIYVAP
jgi:TolB protein